MWHKPSAKLLFTDVAYTDVSCVNNHAYYKCVWILQKCSFLGITHISGVISRRCLVTYGVVWHHTDANQLFSWNLKIVNAEKQTGLSPPVKYFYWPFQDGTFVDHFVYVLCLSCLRVCLLLPCGHLLGKGWPLGSCFCDVFCHCPMWYPGSGVAIDCIDSWSLPPFLL